jgi:hypothetical protein
VIAGSISPWAMHFSKVGNLLQAVLPTPAGTRGYVELLFSGAHDSPGIEHG